MTIQEHEFIEVEYTGKLDDGTVFDTTDENLAKKTPNYNKDVEYKPMTICVGEQQLVRGLDAALIGKEVGKSYTIKLAAEQAFGKKDAKKIRLVPANTFYKQQIMPAPGLEVNIDGTLARVLRVSGGRILVDYNHPLAGKEVTYEITIRQKITAPEDQIRSYLELSLPKEMVKEVTVTDNKAKVTLTHDLPEPITREIGKRLVELTKVQSVDFQTEKKENKQEKLSSPEHTTPE